MNDALGLSAEGAILLKILKAIEGLYGKPAKPESFIRLKNATIAASWIVCIQVFDATEVYLDPRVAITLRDGIKILEETPTLEDACRLRQKLESALSLEGGAK